ncbi:Phosphatidylinositol kinase (PIK-L2) [Achlya hypogyna]|uniref:Serine/threonine-protein kinase TOR n=1 Tax=Achlya hypogyna TaxID=1202772 RepID=A0A1V9YMT2_ACHHY|nr:Phosphatidylinositol kinase (PIK-L2) [Achlya hypogyna]
MTEATAFSRFLPGLRSGNATTRTKTARTLCLYLESEARDLPMAEYATTVGAISGRIIEMILGADIPERTGGIVAMDNLVDLFIADNQDSKISEFAHALIKVFEKTSNTEIPTLKAGGKALGHLVSSGGTSLIEFIEDYHMKPALSWLEKESFQVRRQAAVIIMRELAINAPAILFRHIDTFFDVIWNAFGDAKQPTREGAADALQACFALLQARDSNRKNMWYARTLDEVHRGTQRGTPEAIHGALLILNELLRNSGDFMYPHYVREVKEVLGFRDHRSSIVRRAVINLLPRLAKFNSSTFLETFYRSSMSYLLEVASMNNPPAVTRGDALLSIGKLSLAIGAPLARDERTLDMITHCIKLGLAKKKDKKDAADTQREALNCLRMLADAIGTGLAKVNLEATIQCVFQCELDKGMIDTLTTLMKRLPSQKMLIQNSLFKQLIKLLETKQTGDASLIAASPSRHRSKTYNNLNTSSGGKTSVLNILSSAIQTGKLEYSPSTPALAVDAPNIIGMQVLALDTLATFDFAGNRHIPIVQRVHSHVVRFLDHDVASVRKSAAITCCKLVLPAGEEARSDVAGPVSTVLQKLLTVGIADTEADIRSKVLASLDARFDALLGQPENLRCLFIALNDEVVDIRQTAMTILGRLTHRNPSAVMPSLRQTLVQLLAEIEFSGDARVKDEGALLLGHFLRSATTLARPYVLPTLKVLMKNVRQEASTDGRIQLNKAVVATLGDLAVVGQDALIPYLPQLIPELVEEMKEIKSSTANVGKMVVVVRTLGLLIGSTGYVTRPYHDYPDLLEGLSAALQKSGDANALLRIEAGRTLGIIGALDPYSFQLFQLEKQGRMGSGLLATKQVEQLKANQVIPNDPTWAGMHDDDENGVEQLVIKRLVADPLSQIVKHEIKCVPAEDLLPSLMIGDAQNYFPAVAINALIRILIEPRNASHYQGTLLAIMYICKNLGKKMEPHLEKIIPAFLYALEHVSSDLRVFVFDQLCALVRLMEEKVKPYLDNVAVAWIIQQFWDTHLSNVLLLINEIAGSLGEDFRVYLPDLIPELLRVIRTERDVSNRPQTQLVMRTLIGLGRLLDGYLHLVIPVLVKLIQSNSDFLPRRQALGTLATIVKKLNVSVFASKIIHMLARVIASGHPELVYLAMDCLCAMVYTMGDDYAVFIPVIYQVLHRHPASGDIFDKYDLLVSKVLKYQPLPAVSWATDPLKREVAPTDVSPDELKPLPINQVGLTKAWETTQKSTKDDWHEWMRAMSVELLRESPSLALRACKELASVYQPLARELFNAAFVSLWPNLNTHTQDNLIRALETVLQAPNLPSEILQTLLNLAEFMEHDDQRLPIDITLLGALAEKCHSFAKALHYKEQEFNATPTAAGIEALISINNKLNQFEAAVGIVTYAQMHLPRVPVKASWHEKLQRWDDALAAHEAVLAASPSDVDAVFGKMRCLYATGQWAALNEHIEAMWAQVYGDPRDEDDGAEKVLDVPPALKKELCSNAARVAFTLQNWDVVPKYINSDMDDTEAHLFRAVTCIRMNELEDAKGAIEECRHTMDPTIRSFISESYARAYMPCVVNLQNLAELEEIIAHLQRGASLTKPIAATNRLVRESFLQNHLTRESFVEVQPRLTPQAVLTAQQDDLSRLQKIWTARLLGVDRDIKVWQHVMLVRSLILEPKDDVDVWLKYARLCRKSGHLNLAASALASVGASVFMESIVLDPTVPILNVHMLEQETHNPLVAFAYLKHLWAESKEELALKQLHDLINALEAFDEGDTLVALRVQAYTQLGKWQVALTEPKKHSDSMFDQVLGCLNTATRLDPTNGKAWHEWALMNFRATESSRDDPAALERYAAAAIHGFFKSIAFGHRRYDVTKDVLRLLTLWFNHGGRPDVHAAMTQGLAEVSIDTWLEFIPQLIARLHSPTPNMNALLHQLLTRIGQHHPQALIYPITVASSSVGTKRKLAAEGILAAVRRHSPQLVQEAELVSRELIRVAILWNELWHGALEEASRLYFAVRDTKAMLNELAPLHKQLDSIGAMEEPTLREVAFYQAFARDLQQAKAWTDRFELTQNNDDLSQAWDLYFNVFNRIKKQMANLSTLELANVGPKLLSVSSLSLAIPGTYKAGVAITRIQSFGPQLTVLTSKQRPRKVVMHGSDGKAYTFLLKGHEDLRQDERVMQLFGLINTLLANDSDTRKRNLAIQRFSVLPLSHTSGLIGWVENTDTLHMLIRDYREARKIQLNVEYRLMVQMAPDYEKLAVANKVEVFQHAMNETTGQDLYKVLWLKSQNSEVWLDRRRNYTRSLAVMSMAGYILGLGDRHPGNLMLHRVSGKIVHIDFGDCFEVAIEREKYPEKVPFRLTRMLSQAMEVSGLEGTFRYTCEASMRVLRENRDSLMAILEAFVHDPLITWRLLAPHAAPSHAYETEEDKASGPKMLTDADDAEKAKHRRSSADSMLEFMPLDKASKPADASLTLLGRSVFAKEAATDEELDEGGVALAPEQLNAKAVKVIDRVKKKLRGRDFDNLAPGQKQLSVESQVDRLIEQATSHENLCQLYYGWCPFW